MKKLLWGMILILVTAITAFAVTGINPHDKLIDANKAYEKGDFDGGFCVLKEERIIVVNKRLVIQKRASVLAQALAEVGIEEVYLKPAVRQFIEDELARSSTP